MGEFASMEDWGLQAVIKGHTNEYHFPTTFSTDHNPLSNSFGPQDHIIQKDHDPFPDLFLLQVNELEELYKPFYPVFHSFSPQANNIITSSSSSSSVISVPQEVKQLVPEKMKIPRKQAITQESVIVTGPSTAAHPAKYKRRKNQHKRVVVHLTAEGLSSDLWAWRKYGQKPIKGSPYPRSYYRCSSSKGCLARKQVEKSNSDPGMFIVTYTSEHSHAQPTRRSSLAGTNRHKFSTKNSSTATDGIMATAKDSSGSPKSPLIPSREEVAVLFQQHPHDEPEEQMVVLEENNEDESVISDMLLRNDFFVGFEDLDSAFYNGEQFH